LCEACLRACAAVFGDVSKARGITGDDIAREEPIFMAMTRRATLEAAARNRRGKS
jgi:hypothetical protein